MGLFKEEIDKMKDKKPTLTDKVYGGGGFIKINQNKKTIFTYPHANPKNAAKHINAKLKEMGHTRDATGLYARAGRSNIPKKHIQAPSRAPIETRQMERENILLGRKKKTIKEAKSFIAELLKDFKF